MSALVSWPVARATARERGLAPLNLVIAGVLVLLGMVKSSADAWGAEAFSSMAAAWFFLLTLLLGARLLSEEIESGHAQLVLLRPITRAQYAGGRFLGAAFVLCAAGAAAWASSLVAALLRGGANEVPGRILVLPLALLPALGWLATLLAVGAVTSGWTNAGILVAARVGWFLLRLGLPVALPRLGLGPWVEAIDHYFGPQDALMIARQAQYGERIELSPALWDLLWLFAAWLAAVRLFNLRELARRRA